MIITSLACGKCVRSSVSKLSEDFTAGKERSRELEAHVMDLEEALKQPRNSNEVGTSIMKQMPEEGTRLQSELEARTAQFERKFARQ